MSAARLVLALGAIALAVTFLPPRARRDPPKHARARVGLVFDVGGRGDKSFNDAAYAGLLRAERELEVEIAVLEPATTEDREAGLRLFSAQKMSLVLGVGFIFSADIDAVARAYPEVRFACVDYAPHGAVPPNVAGLAFREEEGAYLVGGVAGLLSKSKHVGFVGGMTIPLIKKFEVGYAAGARAVCPACEVHVGYAGSSPEAFKDPTKGKLLAKAQIGAGADVLFHAAGATGHGVFEGAREGGALAIGVDSDQRAEMPGVVVTSMIKRVDVAVFEIIKDALEGRFTAGVRALGLKEGGLDFVRDGLAPEVVRRVSELRDEVAEGRVRVPSE